MVEDDVHLKKFQKELSAGTVSLALLAVLAQAGEPLYGYLIAKELERVGEGVLSGKQSALYPVLRNLEGAGLLESHVEPSSSGPPRRYYRINERGREVLAQWRQAGRPPAIPSIPCWRGTAMNDPSRQAAPCRPPSRNTAQLRAALEGADPAMVQDALYDAEEYLRSELAAQPGRSEAEVIADVAGSYGAPDEVAEIYRETEVTVNRALRTPRADTAPVLRAAAEASGVEPASPPPAPVQRSLLARVFGVVTDPHTYGALFYMLLSLATGIFFFTWVVTGLSLSLGLLILIVGIPLTVLFFGSVRGLALLEGRLVEALLGERMPRRPRYTDRSRTRCSASATCSPMAAPADPAVLRADAAAGRGLLHHRGDVAVAVPGVHLGTGGRTVQR